MHIVRALSREAIDAMVTGSSAAEVLNTYNVVSCLDTGLASPFTYSVYRERFRSLLTLQFDDVGQPLINWDHHSDPWTYRKFSTDDVDRLAQWFQNVDIKKPFLTHCWMGISRSGTVGLYLNRWLGGTDADYFEANPRVCPNPLMESVFQEVWERKLVR